jgi:hypothetical protein
MRLGSLLLFLTLPCIAQLPKAPDTRVQREAMKKLAFLAGKWSGEALVWRAPGEPLRLLQTEEAEYKLDGLILTIEGVGRAASNGEAILQALGTISYDDEAGAYRMRAYNDGRFLETDIMLDEKAKTLTWGFTFGPIRTSSTLRITEAGQWTEVGLVTMGSGPPKKVLELTVQKR